DFGNRQAVPAKMSREFEKSRVFFADAIQNADRAEAAAGEPYDTAPRAAELALQRQHALHRSVKALLKKFFQDIHIYPSDSGQSNKSSSSIAVRPGSSGLYMRRIRFLTTETRRHGRWVREKSVFFVSTPVKACSSTAEDTVTVK